MKIEIGSPIIKLQVQNETYSVAVETYAGDADYFETVKFENVAQTDIKQFLIELAVVRRQFVNGRGGSSAMYNQRNYFLADSNDEGSNDEDTSFELDFGWIDMISFDGDAGQNYTIDSIVVTYCASHVEHEVSYFHDREFYEDIAKLNSDHQIGDIEIWRKWRTRMDLEELFEAYREDAVALVKRWVNK